MENNLKSHVEAPAEAAKPVETVETTAPVVNEPTQSVEVEKTPAQSLKERRAQRREAFTNAIDAAVKGEVKEEVKEPEAKVEMTKEAEAPKDLPAKPVIESKEPEPEVDPNERFTQAFNKLNKRERDLQERSQNIKQKEAELKELGDLYALAKQDPEKFLEHAGWDYDKLTRHKLESPLSEEPKVNPEIEAIKKKQDAIEAQLQKDKQEAASKRLKTAINGVKSDLTNLISKNEQNYELCKIYGSEAVDIVYNVMDNYYTENQRVLSYEDALEATEKWLYETRVKPASQAQKLKDLLNNKPSNAPQETEGEPKQHGQQASRESQTMTNDLSAPPTTGENRKLTRDERRELAKKTLKWND